MNACAARPLPLAFFISASMHPSDALFQGKHQPVSPPVCDHYAESEKLMRQSRRSRFRYPAALHTKLAISAVGRAYGKITSHNACTDIGHFPGVADDALGASQTLGYGRMLNIHPDQIGPIVKAFAPASDETEDATALLLAAQSAGWGPIQYKATWHDRPSDRDDWAVLQRAKQSGQRLPETAGALM